MIMQISHEIKFRCVLNTLKVKTFNVIKKQRIKTWKKVKEDIPKRNNRKKMIICWKKKKKERTFRLYMKREKMGIFIIHSFI